MTDRLTEIRDRWEREKSIYRELAVSVKQYLTDLLHQNGIQCRVSSREKDTTSLMKKVLRKDYTDYAQITDKAGVRVVVPFSGQLSMVDAMIQEWFHVLERDDKSAGQATDTFGYLAIHYLVSLKGCSDDKFASKACEIQLRTLCQDTWSEMAHFLSYKSDLVIPSMFQRQINRLSALMELADQSFSQLETDIHQLPNQASFKILNQLEVFHYRLIGTVYDKALSIDVIDCLKGLFESEELSSIKDIISQFVDRNDRKMKLFLKDYSNKLMFASQPEIFILLNRLEKDHFQLEEAWGAKYPLNELEDIAMAWGMPINS